MARRGHRARVWLTVGSAMVLLAAGAVSFVFRAGMTEPVTGVEWVQASAGPIAIQVTEGSLAERSGLKPGDRLVRIGDRAVHSALDASQLAWSSEAGRPLPLHVQRGETVIELDLEASWQRRPEPYTYLALVGLAFWVSGLFIAVRWPGIRGGVVYTALAFSLFAELTLSHTGRGDAPDWIIYWGDLVAGALVPPLLLHLGIVLSRSQASWKRWMLGGAYALSSLSLLAALWLSPAVMGGAYRFVDPVTAIEVRDRAEPLLLALALLLTVTLLARAYARSSSVLRRGQIRWLLWGLAVGLGPFVMLYAAPWALGAPELPAWAQFISVIPMLFVPAAFTAALARYRLHDLDLFLLRGFAEVTALFCTAAVYSASVFLLREVLDGFLPLSRSATRYGGMLAAIVAYHPIRNWVRAGVDRAFYSKRYSYRATLLDWSRELNLETNLGSLLERLRGRIRETLGVPAVEVFLRTADRRFKIPGSGDAARAIELEPAAIDQLSQQSQITVEEGQFEAAPWARYVFAMNVKGRVRAVLVVSERDANEEPLTTEDRALLSTLAAHTATAIEAARLMLEVRQRADEIERLHERQAMILESSAVGLLLLDPQGRIQAWNRALEESYGLPRDQAIGRRLADVLPLHVVRRIEREDRRGSATGQGRIFRITLANRRGRRLVANLAISSVDEGRSDGAKVVTFDDVSERVKLEEQVLRQEKLASLGLLAAGVAHEINTPLTGISSYAQMMIEECAEDDPRRELLSKIEDQTTRASGITRSLLNLARPERTIFEPLCLNETVNEVLQLFAPQVRGSGVEIRTQLDPGLPDLIGHKGKLQQVLLNLLLNARDAVEAEGTISVTTRVAGGRVVLEVADNGAGIAEEDIGSVFDPFFTTKGRGKGTGLGLSICYGIVQEHQGVIQVQSRPGRGTCFTVELPSAETARAMA